MTIKVHGKHNVAIIHSSVPQETAITQIQELVDQPFMADTKIHIMPDYHAGAGCVIGTTIELNGKVVPNLVGVDVGCGVSVWELGNIDIDFQKLDSVIRQYIPSGKDIHTKIPVFNRALGGQYTSDKFFTHGLDDEKTMASLGTLGGGNHFIEIAEGTIGGSKYLLVHTGSRYIGAKVAKYHQDVAKRKVKQLDSKPLIEKLKAEGRHSEIEAELKKLKASHVAVPSELAYLEGEDFDRYIDDMRLAQDYAKTNRRLICVAISAMMNWGLEDESLLEIDTVHNYIDTDSLILRKGAVRALEGERLVIPLNMADGSLLCVGKGNPDWNYSAPHGAGRIMSRAQARANLSMSDFQSRTSYIWSSTVVDATLDEAPMAYKPMQEIVDAIGDTVEIIDVLKPLYNFKGIE